MTRRKAECDSVKSQIQVEIKVQSTGWKKKTRGKNRGKSTLKW